MNKDYYKEYYHLERNHWWFRVRESIIREQLERFAKQGNSELKILNIGAATGRSSEMLSQFGEVTSVEYDDSCREFTRELTGMDILPGSILELQFQDNSFDLVCAFDVIEHVEDDKKAVEEMLRVCKRDGLVCVTVPAFMSLWGKHDEINMHFRRYTLPQVIRLFSNRKSFLKTTYFNTLLFPFIWGMRKIGSLTYSRNSRKDSGSDFGLFQGNSLLDRLFYATFNMERKILKQGKFPFGVSIFVLYKNS